MFGLCLPWLIFWLGVVCSVFLLLALLVYIVVSISGSNVHFDYTVDGLVCFLFQVVEHLD